MITIGIDPGARNTACVVRSGDSILLSSTYVRSLDMNAVTWAVYCVDVIKKDVLSLYPDAKIGIEGVSDPKGYQNGKLSPINPKDIIRTAMVVGALAEAFREYGAVIVPPKKNGSSGVYPSELNDRRPKDLPGQSTAGTRRHEKSAYDVAGEVLFLVNDGYVLDERPEFV